MDIWRKWRNPRQKPPFGVRIDWSDQITDGLVGCWLFNEIGTAAITDLVDGSVGRLKAAWAGETVDLTQAADYIEHPWRAQYSLSSTLTLAVKYKVLTTESYKLFLGKPYYPDQHTSPWYDYGLLTYAGGNFHARLCDIVRNTSGSYYSVGDVIDAVLWWAGGAPRIFCNGKECSYENTSTISQLHQSTAPIRFGLAINNSSDDIFGYVYHGFLWNRPLLLEEIERLYYEPYSFFLVPAARIFDLAPSYGFTTTQDIAWRLFTSKENQIIYNILTDKQASFGYKIFDRKDNSITYRIFTQDGSSFTWKIFTSSNQDISYKIFTRLQSDLSWASASTALSQAITYKIFTRNEVNLSWLILTAEAASLDWSIFTTKEQQAIWNILAQTETDLLWDVYTSKDATLAYKIFKDLEQDLIYKIFNSTEQDLVWKILAAGLLSEILSWKIYAKQEDDLSWKILAAEQQEFFYKIFNVKEDEITWLIKREDTSDLSWKLFNLKEDPILWKIYSQAEKTIAWSILAALTSQDISYKIFTVKDEELFYNILAEASKSLDWKIYNEKGEELTWRIISEILPEPTYHLKDSKRVFVINPTRGIIITKE